MSDKPFTKYLIYIGILFLGLVVGIIVGMRLGTRAALFARDLTAISSYSFYAEIQLKYAEYPEAKETLLNFIKLLEDSRDSNDPMVSESSLTFDKMLTYGRLARLAQKNGDELDAKKFMALAVEECSLTSWKDCSDEKVEHVLTEVERRALLPDKSPDN